jgi:hypothetical protein
MRFIDDGRQRRPCEPGGGASNEIPICEQPETRRTFIKQAAGTSVAIAIGPNLVSSALGDQSVSTSTTAITNALVKVSLTINGKNYPLDIDPRVALVKSALLGRRPQSQMPLLTRLENRFAICRSRRIN